MEDAPTRTWHRYEELRPDQLDQIVSDSPVAFWPLGLLEHHGWHLPIGFDGLKADRICQRVAAGTGGVVLPTMWWGGGGGHDPFRWTHYQDQDAAGSMVGTTVVQLLRHGFRAIVLLAGHYPWQSTLDKVVPPLQQLHPQALLLYGTEMSMGGDAVRLKGDHAAREETSMGLALIPDLVDLDSLTAGRGQEAWPQGQAPPVDGRHPGVEYDPAEPLFSQMGEDARLATGQRGDDGLGPLVVHLTQRLLQHLQGS